MLKYAANFQTLTQNTQLIKTEIQMKTLNFMQQFKTS